MTHVNVVSDDTPQYIISDVDAICGAVKEPDSSKIDVDWIGDVYIARFAWDATELSTSDKEALLGIVEDVGSEYDETFAATSQDRQYIIRVQYWVDE